MIRWKSNKWIKTIAIVVSMLFPCTTVALLFGVETDFILNVLWCGFYGCILVCLAVSSKWIKAAIILLNLISFVFLSLGFMMGGSTAPFWMLLKAVLPFLPLR